MLSNLRRRALLNSPTLLNREEGRPSLVDWEALLGGPDGNKEDKRGHLVECLLHLDMGNKTGSGKPGSCCRSNLCATKTAC